jgi:beta-lactamase family protein
VSCKRRRLDGAAQERGAGFAGAGAGSSVVVLAAVAALAATAAGAGAKPKQPLTVELRLPQHGSVARAERSHDAALARRLAGLGRSYRGWAAFWVHDLRTGATAGWNSDARFPAASMVKLGVLAAVLRRYGPYPERSAAWRDLRIMARTSDNAAANRLVARLGGLAPVQEALLRLGMRSSTYPGPYREETGLGDAPKPPPIHNWRVTTAHDLSRALYTFQAAALGNRWVERRSGLTRHEAEVGLALLLSTDPRGANVGLLRPSLPGVRLAQKNGWVDDMLGTAAIVYLGRGPKIVVVLVHRPEVSFSEAQALGRRVTRMVR